MFPESPANEEKSCSTAQKLHVVWVYTALNCFIQALWHGKVCVGQTFCFNLPSSGESLH